MKNLHRGIASRWLCKVRVFIAGIVVDLSIVELIDDAIVQAATFLNRPDVVIVNIRNALLVVVINVDSAEIVDTRVDVCISGVDDVGITLGRIR